jgi:2-polyprenyl-3-methyl-5-hydroxy-6-metoxy-1,4-benzoquinol methylase
VATGTFNEADIRPSHIADGQMVHTEADRNRLLRFKDRFEFIACPACAEEMAVEAFVKHELRYVTCKRCETLYINPRPTPEILEHCYSHSEVYDYWNQHMFPASEEARRDMIFRPRVKKVIEFCKSLGIDQPALMEVGAAYGTFCEEARRSGVFRRIVAVEPTPALAQTLRDKGFEVVESCVEKVAIENESLDVIVSFEVIEHLFSPRDFFRKCADMLSPGGVLIVTCPNVKGFDILTLRELSSSVDHEHLNYFNPDSLSLLAARCGLTPVESLTPGQLDAELVRKAILKGEFDASSQPFLKRVLIDKWDELGEPFQQFLASHRLSSHQWLVARKNGDSDVSVHRLEQ